jgi:hypothetical protein
MSFLIYVLYQILIPTQGDGKFSLFILDKENRKIYILDPTPLDPMYQYNPSARYVKKNFYGLPSTYLKLCLLYALGLDGMKIFFCGVKKC